MKVQIFGFGKMGRIHAKYLHMQGIEYSIYDPYLTDFDFTEYYSETVSFDRSATHFIISSPIDKHYENYKFIRERTNAPILVEKPYSLVESEMEEMVKDDNLSIGMCLRFDYRIYKILDNKSPVIIGHNVHFRTPLQEVLIHYIDLLFNQFGELPIRVHKFDKSIYIDVGKNSVVFSNIKEAPAISFVYQDERVAVSDREVPSPILLEQISFFNGNYIKSYLPHKSLINTLNQYGHITF